MITDTDTVSSWFVLNGGFKVYGRCPACHSPRISYHKARIAGHKGIAPACIDCGKCLPVRFKKDDATPPRFIARRTIA